MKLSVSVPDEDVAFLDAYAQAHSLPSRSAALQRAVYLLRLTQLGNAYSAAWSEWDASGDSEDWESVVGDGL